MLYYPSPDEALAWTEADADAWAERAAAAWAAALGRAGEADDPTRP